jgi:hypothetical protein
MFEAFYQGRTGKENYCKKLKTLVIRELRLCNDHSGVHVAAGFTLPAQCLILAVLWLNPHRFGGETAGILTPCATSYDAFSGREERKEKC